VGLGDRLLLTELRHDAKRDVDLPDPSKGSPDTPQPAAGAPGRSRRDVGRAERQDLAQTSGGDAALMEWLDFPLHGLRQVLAKRPHLTLVRTPQGMQEGHDTMGDWMKTQDYTGPVRGASGGVPL
jgi:hypothetical protein